MGIVAHGETGMLLFSRMSEKGHPPKKADKSVESAPPPQADALAEVTAKLRAGEISAEQAVERLIDDAIRRQVGRSVNSAVEPELREMLRGYAARDPFLVEKLRKLTTGGPANKK